jgi:hypothetical protein
LVRKSEGKRPLGKSRHICEDNTGKNLTEIGWEGVNWIHQAHDTQDGILPSGSIKGGEFHCLVTISFSKRTLLHGVG